jgi:hypothetical protein
LVFLLELSMAENNELNQLKRLGRYWQKRLGLSHWTIHFSFDELEGCVGNCDWDAHTQEATLKIHPGLAIPRYTDGGVEATLIHELLHIVWQGHEPEGEVPEPLATIIEVAINRIADALCRTKVKRGKKT